MLDGLEPEVRADYYELYRRVRALAQHGPQSSWVDRVGRRIPLLRDNDEAGTAEMAWLEAAMESTVGRHLDRTEEELAVVVPSAAVSAGKGE